eukprot:7712972-Pyramimonas_sp.AAC.1
MLRRGAQDWAARRGELTLPMRPLTLTRQTLINAPPQHLLAPVGRRSDRLGGPRGRWRLVAAVHSLRRASHIRR